MIEMKDTPETPEKPKAPDAEKPDVSVEEKPQAKENMFSDDNLSKDSVVETDAPVEPKKLDLGAMKRDVTITPEDKVAFIDAVVENRRFTKGYSLFGGRITVTVRSLTTDEVNALSAWTVRQGNKDSAGLLAGRYRKYLMAAHIAMLNGVELPPLEEPLFETVKSDGKTTLPPGWVKRCDQFDGMDFGRFNAIMGCIADFDTRYSILCQKAEDANFWNPDTP